MLGHINSGSVKLREISLGYVSWCLLYYVYQDRKLI